MADNSVLLVGPQDATQEIVDNLAPKTNNRLLPVNYVQIGVRNRLTPAPENVPSDENRWISEEIFPYMPSGLLVPEPGAMTDTRNEAFYVQNDPYLSPEDLIELNIPPTSDIGSTVEINQYLPNVDFVMDGPELPEEVIQFVTALEAERSQKAPGNNIDDGTHIRQLLPLFETPQIDVDGLQEQQEIFNNETSFEPSTSDVTSQEGEQNSEEDAEFEQKVAAKKRKFDELNEKKVNEQYTAKLDWPSVDVVVSETDCEGKEICDMLEYFKKLAVGKFQAPDYINVEVEPTILMPIQMDTEPEKKATETTNISMVQESSAAFAIQDDDMTAASSGVAHHQSDSIIPELTVVSPTHYVDMTPRSFEFPPYQGSSSLPGPMQNDDISSMFDEFPPGFFETPLHESSLVVPGPSEEPHILNESMVQESSAMFPRSFELPHHQHGSIVSELNEEYHIQHGYMNQRPFEHRPIQDNSMVQGPSGVSHFQNFHMTTRPFEFTQRPNSPTVWGPSESSYVRNREMAPGSFGFPNHQIGIMVQEPYRDPLFPYPDMAFGYSGTLHEQMSAGPSGVHSIPNHQYDSMAQNSSQAAFNEEKARKDRAAGYTRTCYKKKKTRWEEAIKANTGIEFNVQQRREEIFEEGNRLITTLNNIHNLDPATEFRQRWKEITDRKENNVTFQKLIKDAEEAREQFKAAEEAYAKKENTPHLNPKTLAATKSKKKRRMETFEAELKNMEVQIEMTNQDQLLELMSEFRDRFNLPSPVG